MHSCFGYLFMLHLACLSCRGAESNPPPTPSQKQAENASTLPQKEEHLANLRQLSYGMGENAEAYWSFDSKQLIFQSKRPPFACDQIFSLPIEGSQEARLLSTGQGRTTCAYFLQGNDRIIYSSTHLQGEACPPEPNRSQGYVWPIYASYDIFTAQADGTNPQQLTNSPGYDAEATVCAKDGSIVFTSIRDGDLELYRMDSDGKNVKRLTHTPGYDGGAFFSADCSKIVWRASRPLGQELADYQRLLTQGLVRPHKMELFVANADGSEAYQVTYLQAASFAPFFYPSGRRILFSSNVGDPKGREFELWAINIDGTELEQITHSPGFDGFPMFSPDGKKLAFASNRNQKNPGETDIYIADWLEHSPRVSTTSAADRLMADIRWLADDQREGRGLGTQGIKATEEWLVERMKAMGLASGYGPNYRQAVEVVVKVEQGQETKVQINEETLSADQFVPASASASAQVSGELVWANYGITAPELGVDDYRGRSVAQKIVVVRRFVPSTRSFADADVQARYSDIRYKAWNAREHGAVALMVVDLPAGSKLPEEAPLPALKADRNGDAGIPVIFLKREQGQKLWKGSHRAHIAVQLQHTKAEAMNVVGKIQGGKTTDHSKAIILGAHYDHLGYGGKHPSIHNGADDNASGTAVLLEVARELQAKQADLAHDVYIVAFSAEELGLIGSAAWTRNPPPGLELSKTIAMINFDMVGRLRDNTVSVLGGETATEWSGIVNPICEQQGIQCKLSGDGYGPSDHMSFYAVGIPVLHFFTGSHKQYHQPEDDAEYINAAGTAKISEVVTQLVMQLSHDVVERNQPLSYQRIASPSPSHGDRRSAGASMGTIPDYSGSEGEQAGVLLAGVRVGGPAEKAGLQRGDRIVQIGRHKIQSIHDLMFVLESAHPGQKVTVVIVRDGQQVRRKLTYGHRPSHH